MGVCSRSTSSTDIKVTTATTTQSYYYLRLGHCGGGQPMSKMKNILLMVAAFCASALSDDVARKPKLFFVSTSATTSTLQTASICYVSSATIATCTGRKRRTISLDGVAPEGAV